MPPLQEALPKFLQIANYIRDQILQGELRPGDEVPSERALAEQFAVSRPTATKALETLRTQGLVMSRQGAGSFVADQRLNRRAQQRYSRSRLIGRVYPPDEWAEIHEAALVDAPAHVAEALGVEAGAAVARRYRVVHGPEGPVECSTSWFTRDVADAAPRVLETDRIREGTLAYVEAATGRRARYARDRLTARTATARERRHLRLKDDLAVLAVQHVVYDAADRALEYADATFPPGRWTFEQEYPVTA